MGRGAGRAYGTDIDVHEAVPGIDECQQDDGEVLLVIEEVGATQRRVADADMLPINGAKGVREVPPVMKSLRDLLPLLRCRWQPQFLVTGGSDNSSACFRNNAADGVVGNLECIA